MMVAAIPPSITGAARLEAIPGVGMRATLGTEGVKAFAPNASKLSISGRRGSCARTNLVVVRVLFRVVLHGRSKTQLLDTLAKDTDLMYQLIRRRTRFVRSHSYGRT
eukprot:2360374-Prymnesium_polylepis.1